MSHLHLIYDARDNPVLLYALCIVPFLILGLVMGQTIFRKDSSWTDHPQGTFVKFFFLALVAFTWIFFIGCIDVYYTTYHALKTGDYKTVEGPITHLNPHWHRGESITVQGVEFGFSDSGTDGFLSRHALHVGVYVRITYIGDTNILTFEVK